MRIAVIGGTGGTGTQIIKQALEKGHQVRALVRNPKKMKVSHPNLSIVQGNVLDINKVIKVFENQDGVISALGHKRFILKSTLLSKGTEVMISAMADTRISRFICITALGISDTRFKLGLYYTLFVEPFILFFYFRDKEKQEKLIKNSALDWTIVRPGQLFNGKKRGRYKHGPGLGSYILTKMISRADVAHFIIHELENNNYVKKAATVVY